MLLQLPMGNGSIPLVSADGIQTFSRRRMGQSEGSKARRRTPDDPLNLESGECRYALEPADDLSPERLYEKQWALTFLDHVLNRLRDEFVAKRQGTPIPRHSSHSSVAITNREATKTRARALGITEAAAKMAVHRMRRRYREILRAEIAETVAEPGEVDDEIRNLRATLG